MNVMTSAHNVWASLVADNQGCHHLTDDLIDALTVPNGIISDDSLAHSVLTRKYGGEADMWRMAVAATLSKWAATPGSETTVDFVRYG